MYRRARHVITENERTQQAVEALKSNSIKEFGHLMNESHNSLRYVQQDSILMLMFKSKMSFKASTNWSGILAAAVNCVSHESW